MVERLAEIGIVPGNEFERSKLPVPGDKLDEKMGLIEMGLHLKRQKTTNIAAFLISKKIMSYVKRIK